MAEVAIARLVNCIDDDHFGFQASGNKVQEAQKYASHTARASSALAIGARVLSWLVDLNGASYLR